MNTKAESIWSRLSWPQVAALGIIVAGAVLTATFAPIPWADLPWEAILGAALSIGGIGALGASGPLVRPRSSSTPDAPRAPTPVRRPDHRRDGSVTAEVLGIVLAWAAATVIASMLTGCSANPLAMHVRAATVVTSALEGVAPLVRATVEHRIESECGPVSAGDSVCVESLRLRMAPDLALLDVPVLATREALTVYVRTLDLLLEADVGADVDVLGALGALAGRLVGVWPDLVAALRPLGVELPIPPLLELAAAMIGGAR